MKILFLTPPLKAWDSHGLHKAANQMHAQVAAYVRSKGIANVEALDCRAMDMDWDAMLNKIAQSKPDMIFNRRSIIFNAWCRGHLVFQ